MIPVGFRIRQARVGDLPALWPLARRLNSYNLPADRRMLAQLVATSVQSFRGAVTKARARYLFVLERRPVSQGPPGRRPQIIGCSLILAKHGTPRLPHLWMDVKTVRMASRTLRRRIVHQVLQLGMTTDGPTEIGGLIVHPAYRGRPERFGRQLSYARFVYMAMHPERFEPRVLVEYLPPLTRRGDSLLWQAFGRRFTGLSYRWADRLSMTNKEFILRLFPRTPVYTAVFPPVVRRQIGVVHPAAAGACAMLQGIGFRSLRQVEPFDGGPYFGALRRRITVVRRTRRGTLAVTPALPPARWGLLCAEPAVGEFRALQAPYRWHGARLEVTEATAERLDGRAGMEAYAVPLAR